MRTITSQSCVPHRREFVTSVSGLLLRRQRVAQPISDVAFTHNHANAEMIRVGDVVLDAARHEVFVRGVETEFPLREFQLLRELLENAGRQVTRA